MVTNVRKLKYFPKVARVLGARRAKRELQKVNESEVELTYAPSMITSFYFRRTPQGFDFWCKLNEKCRDL